MPTYDLTITLKSPLAISRSRQATNTKAVERVPGSTILGALAERYLATGGSAEDNDFEHLFLDPDATRIWPAGATDVLPITTETCKLRPSGEHGIVDTLLERVLLELHPEREAPRCSFVTDGHPCGQPLKRYEARPVRATRTHVGINRALATKEAAILYAQEAIEPWNRNANGKHSRTVLHGAVETDERGLGALERLLCRADHGTVYLGRSRTRGLGEAQVALGPARPERTPKDWLDVGKKAAARLAQNDKRWDPKRTILIALHFPAGAILVDEFLRATNDPATALDFLPALPTAEELFASDEGPSRERDGVRLTLAYADAELELVRGWQAAHGLPRADDLALRPGSLIAYRAKAEEPAALEAFLERTLAPAVARGIGLRRSEGFGRVVVNDAVHVERDVGNANSHGFNQKGKQR
jgi:CRISPR-associated Csx10 family RAMP protein